MRRRHIITHDVARLAGVSRTTVSLVLNNIRHIRIREETRWTVLESARKLGYVPDAPAGFDDIPLAFDINGSDLKSEG